MQAFSVRGGSCYTVNLSRNLVPGIMHHTVNGVEYNVNERIGLPENARYTDLVTHFAERMPEQKRRLYLAFFDRERLCAAFARGEVHQQYEYWTEDAGKNRALVQRHIVMFRDEPTGELLACSYALDRTAEHDAAEYRRRMKQEQQLLEKTLSAAQKTNREQVRQLQTMADELEESVDQLDKERYRNELLMEQIYYSTFRIDLETDTYEELYRKEGVAPLMRRAGTASTELRELCERFIVPQHRAQMLRFFDLTTAAARLRHEHTISTECKTMDGNWHQASFIAKHRNEQGEVIHILYVTREISDEKRREERLISLAEDANEANLAKTDFISRVAHDIRTPMNSIFGFLEIAEANAGDRERVQYCLKKIRVAGEFLKGLVDDVLDISSIENGRMILNKTEMSLSHMMEEFSASISNAKFDKQQELRFAFDDLYYDRVVTDPLRLRQIYTNVMTNAIKYTPNGGRIGFTLRQEKLADSDQVRLIAVVTDTGIGMSEEFMGKMFTKFERAADSRINSVSGYGLGLPIVKQLVELMHGTIDVQSKLGEGSTFTIRLDVPYVVADAPKESAQDADDGARCAGMHLLVAEDNELNREVITELLALYHITCDCAENGAVCLERFSNAPEGTYDAILMDMQMPVMNGVESAKAIRALPKPWAKTIPMIAMTANALKEDIRTCLDAGMNRHLAKPVDIKRLLRVLTELIQAE